MLQRFPKAKSKLTSVAGEEFSHGAEGFGADMVFDALGIDAGGFCAYAKSEQEFFYQGVLAPAILSHLPTLGGEEDRAVGFLGYQFGIL
jgi:hypothetical protein